MPARGGQRGRRTRARNLCHHFDGTELATCARPGLSALEAEHKTVVLGGQSIGCGIALDRCRQMREPDVRRWDYIFIVRDTDSGIGIEVHHTDPNEVDVMIAKKRWRRNYSRSSAPTSTSNTGYGSPLRRRARSSCCRSTRTLAALRMPGSSSRKPLGGSRRERGLDDMSPW